MGFECFRRLRKHQQQQQWQQLQQKHPRNVCYEIFFAVALPKVSH